MASHSPNEKISAIRHRIKEITLHPGTSKYHIGLEILVDKKTLHRLPNIGPSQPLIWDAQMYPCDAYIGAKVELRFTEKHRTFSDRQVLIDYTVLDEPNLPPVTKQVVGFPSLITAFGVSSNKLAVPGLNDLLKVAVKFPNFDKDYSSALMKASEMMKDSNGPLEKMGNTRIVLKSLLEFGTVVAQLHPAAGLVVGLCTQAWEVQDEHDDLRRLITGLEHMRPFIESVKGRAKEAALKHTTLALLYLIEDTSNSVINYVSRASAGQISQGLSDGKISDRIGELLQKFEELKESFDRGVGVQVLKQVLSSAQLAFLDRLNPAARSHYTGARPCQEGTRTQVLEEIYAWSQGSTTTSKLLWLYGQAGMGKSSIASSICHELDQRKTLGSHFFCKRDDPDLRTPERILNTLVYNLACKYEPYGEAVANAIERNVQLPDSSLEQRYVYLVARPLQSLESTAPLSIGGLFLVVDALDECEQGSGRQLLFSYLREMSHIVPWLRVIVTSRPDEDVEAAFHSSHYGYIVSRSLAEYNSSSDILNYTRTRMAEIASRNKMHVWDEGSVLQLSESAAGLFIWIETACKFIERGADPKRRLKQILDGTQPAEGSSPLDILYSVAIKQGMGDQGADNVEIFRECIGAIVATGSRTPLPASSLGSLLSSYLDPGIVRSIVGALGSVLYEDDSQGGAIRVYHPSFADFILDSARSKEFHTGPKQQNAVLSDCCLTTMMKELMFNICGLETSHLPNDKVHNISMQVQNNISRQLAYSCMHWSDHLTKAPDGNFSEKLDGFMYGPQLLYWIEVMSLLGELLGVVSGLRAVMDSGTFRNYFSYANDAYRLVLTFYDAISHSAPHLYVSALAFAPTGSRVAEQMRPLFTNTFMVTSGGNESWPAWLQTMSHSDAVGSIACSGDGRRIVSGSDDGTVRMWDTETGAAVSEPLESPGVYRVALSFDGRRIASGSEDGTLRVWDTETGATVIGPINSQNGRLKSLLFAPNSHVPFCGYEDGIVRLWNMGAGHTMSELQLAHVDDMLSAALSPDKRLIVSCSKDKTVRLWNTATGVPVTEPLTGHSGWVYCVAFSPNGSLVASGSEDGTVRLWDVNVGTAFHGPMIGHLDEVMSVAFSSSGRYLVSGSSDYTVRVWDVEGGMPACEPLVGHAGWVYSVAFCSSDRRVVSASDDKTAQVWDLESSALVSQKAPGHSDEVNSVAFSQNGQYLASGSDDGMVRFWDPKTGDEAHNPLICGSDAVVSIYFTPDDQRIICLVGHETVQVWEVEAGALVTSFSLAHSEDVLCIALSPDGRHIASGSEGNTVELWDAETGVSVFPPLAAHSDAVVCISFSPDGRFIASGSRDCTVQIWETQTGTTMGRPLIGHSNWVLSVCFSPDSRRVASGSQDQTVRFWDVGTGAALLAPFQGHSGWVNSVVFSPDGLYIISGSDDVTVRIWDADTGAAVARPLVGHSNFVLSVVVSSNSRYIASGSRDRTVRIWDIAAATSDPDSLISALSLAPSTLTLSTGFFTRYVNATGWITSISGDLLFWLPKNRRRSDDSIIQISADLLHHKPLFLDFSKFAHGNDWMSVAWY